jgi:hypothetical protein
MPGTADNFQTVPLVIGPGKLYGDLGGSSTGIWDRPAGERLILFSDGTPDKNQNPNSRHLGYTEAGCEFMVKPTFFQGYMDESIDPVITRATAEECAISGSMGQILDMSTLEIFNPMMTRRDASGTTGMSFGGMNFGTASPYTSVALIFPLAEDPTLYGVFHLYKALADQGLAAKVTRKALAASPFAFRGFAIATRALGDQVGEIFRQNAQGS